LQPKKLSDNLQNLSLACVVELAISLAFLGLPDYSYSIT
jgi:hypothetical protein